MSGINVIGSGTIASNPGLSWNAVGTGDFNGDGHSDILWQNASGQVVDLGNERDQLGSAAGPVSANPGASWRAA